MSHQNGKQLLFLMASLTQSEKEREYRKEKEREQTLFQIQMICLVSSLNRQLPSKTYTNGTASDWFEMFYKSTVHFEYLLCLTPISVLGVSKHLKCALLRECVCPCDLKICLREKDFPMQNSQRFKFFHRFSH